MNNLGKVKLLPAREQVASILRKAILSRELQEGQEITLEGIAELVGVSTTPVREAFQILARDGLIKLRPNKGAVVQGINEKTIRDHYETRAVLEGEAAARASAEGVDLSAVEQAYQIAEKALEDNDSAEYSRYNQAFHMGIWEAADNEKMKSLLSSMWNGLSMGHKVTEEDY
uniref:GntR family transcriptional regulator n=2 Tax=Lachnospiraceae TaxID=186803 RepID=UPI002A7EB255